MSKPNGIVVPLVLLLISTSTFAQKFLVFASPVKEQICKRPDPLHHFKPYGGAYDISNRHYWASAAFAGIHGYAIAGIWLLLGMGFGSYIILKNLNGSSSPVGDHSNSFYILMFSLVVLFTLFAITASGFIMAANKSCLRRAKKLKETIFAAAGDTSQAMRKVINALVHMQTNLRPYDTLTCDLLNVTSHRLRRESLLIHQFIEKTKQPTKKGLEILYFVNLAVVTVNLVLLVAALVFVILHWHPGVMVIIFCCWILTTLSWALTGLDYFFLTFAEDTCSALGKFEKNPQDSSLRFLHPCASSTDSNKLMVQIGYTVHNFITKLNLKITELREVFEMEEREKLGIFGVGLICDPFAGAPNYTYAPQNCSKDAIPIAELANVLSKFTCYKGDSTMDCLGNGKFLPEAAYVMAGAYIQSIQDLIEVFPDVLGLTECSSVKEAFSDIVERQCKPFKKSARMLWSSMLSLSIVMVILVLLWIAKAYQDRQRSFFTFSIVPMPAN